MHAEGIQTGCCSFAPNSIQEEERSFVFWRNLKFDFCLRKKIINTSQPVKGVTVEGKYKFCWPNFFFI